MTGPESIAASHSPLGSPSLPALLRFGPAGWTAILLAVAIALAWRGHFIKPHGDFFEFREVGRDLLAGRIPQSTKRGPVFPLTIGLAERLVRFVVPASLLDRSAAQWAAEWLNAALLPLNACLFLLCARRWCGAAAAWWTCWFVLLPIGVYCTSHTLVEPLLVCLLLATLELSQRSSGWSWVTAALASMARFDLSALILGVWLAGRRDRKSAQNALLAALPLLVWLGLTWATWDSHAPDHYLKQILESGPAWHWTSVELFPLLLPLSSLRLPVWASDLLPLLRGFVEFGLPALCAVGLISTLFRGDRAAIVALVAGAGYVVVHGMFPFHIERFGYPLAPLALLFTAAGTATIAGALRSNPSRTWFPPMRTTICLIIIALAGLAAWAQLDDLRRMLAARPAWPLPAALIALAGAVAIGLFAWRNRFSHSPGGGQGMALPNLVRVGASTALLLVLASAQALTVFPLMADGDEMRSLVDAARCVRDECHPDEVVLSGTAGLLRMVCGDEPNGRFPMFADIRSPDWPGILRECRARNIQLLLWHDQMLDEQGGYYIEKWGLQRFERLSDSATPDGLTLIREFTDPPHVRIFRLNPAGSSSAGASTDTVPAPAGSSPPSPLQTYR